MNAGGRGGCGRLLLVKVTHPPYNGWDLQHSLCSSLIEPGSCSEEADAGLDLEESGSWWALLSEARGA